MNYKQLIADILSKELNKDVFEMLEVPPKQELGDFAFPCFSLSKELKKSPIDIAKNLSSKLIIPDVKISSNGPYVNFCISNKFFVENILKEVLDLKNNFGKKKFNNETIIIDYSGPNVAKNMGIHNLRSTIIGQALVNIHKFLGYNTIGINHLGDWGTQFGKLIWALEKWSSLDELNKKGILFLNEIYVKYHSHIDELKKSNPSLAENIEDESRAWFKKIEDGDKKALIWWKAFIDISLKDYNKIFERLNVKFDDVKGESFYIQFLDETINKLDLANLTSIDDGALVVKFDDSENMPPCLLKKKDGSTLYGTRDLAAALYRLKNYNPLKILYVVDVAQALHFKQVYKVLELLDSSNKEIFEHVSFGRLSFPDSSMSTRKGNIVPLKEVLDKAKEKALYLICEKNPNLEDKDLIAEKVGVGAVIFEDLVHDRTNNIIFEWDKVLDFQGETSPYIQYSIVRINSILKKSDLNKIETNLINFNLLELESEKALAKKINDFKEVLETSLKTLKPHHLAKYILGLAQQFNSYYVNNKIIQEDLELQNARLALAYCVKTILESGLNLLGIESVEAM